MAGGGDTLSRLREAEGGGDESVSSDAGTDAAVAANPEPEQQVAATAAHMLPAQAR